MKKNKITVVFSSHLGKEANVAFADHVNRTIGFNHEVVCIENYNEFSLSVIYNTAMEKYRTNDSIMVFCHPDITFKTKNWGRILINQFINTDYGIIGVAGTTYLAKTARWWEKREGMVGIVQHTNGINAWENKYSDSFYGVRPTIMVDGLFISVDPDKLIHHFDEKYGKFHFYDMGLCVPNYLDGVDVGVVTNIRILHNSVGITNDDWEKNRIKFAEEYSDELPMGIEPYHRDISLKLKRFPKVTVIIPTKDNAEYLIDNLNSWKWQVKYPIDYEIIIADTGSSPETFKKYKDFFAFDGMKIKLVEYDYFNFGKINNDVVKNHVSDDTELVLFCNDDIQLLNDALTRCVDLYNSDPENIGTIGIRLHYIDSTVQHCGIEIHQVDETRLFLTHKDMLKVRDFSKDIEYDCLGNTGAFMLINRELFLKLNGFNESYIDCLEDVELNLRCILDKKINITACDAVAYHYESISRDKNPEKNKNLKEDFDERFYPFFMENQEIFGKYVMKDYGKLSG